LKLFEIHCKLTTHVYEPAQQAGAQLECIKFSKKASWIPSHGVKWVDVSIGKLLYKKWDCNKFKYKWYYNKIAC